MKMPKLKWWQWALIAILGLTFASVMLGNADPSVAPKQPPRMVSSRNLSEGTVPMYAIVVEAGMSRAALAKQARDLCGSAIACQVFGWMDAERVARAIPMTDREASGLVYNYSLNRMSEHEQELWNCAAFPDAPKDRCLS